MHWLSLAPGYWAALDAAQFNPPQLKK